MMLARKLMRLIDYDQTVNVYDCFDYTQWPCVLHVVVF